MNKNIFKNKKFIISVVFVLLIIFIRITQISKLYHKTGDMNVGRAAHTATLLNDGKVLISGGYNFLEGNNHSINLKSTELYDPKKGKFALASNMNYARSFHTATLLKDGRILFVGGNGGYDSKSMNNLTTKTAEIYDPRNGKFTLTGNLVIPRERHSATLLKDGRVLIAGGVNVKYIPPKYDIKTDILNTAEIYDPKTGKFTLAGKMKVSFGENTAVILQNGNVLLASVHNYNRYRHLPKRDKHQSGLSYSLEKYDLYDTSKGIFYPIAVHYHNYFSEFNNLILLSDGNVLNNGMGCAEIYNPYLDKSTTLECKKSRIGYTLSLRSDGKILIAGGETWGLYPSYVDNVETFDLVKKTYSTIGQLNDHRIFHTATCLKTGKILIIGGRIIHQAKVLKSAELH